MTVTHFTATDLARAEPVCEPLADELGPSVALHASSNSMWAVEGKHIVCCATNARTPLFSHEALSGRAHINAIGAFRPTMRGLPSGTLATSCVVVDDRAAVLEESGEVIDALAEGAITESDLVELGTALHDLPPIEGRTVFKSVGVAIQDWAIADALARLDDPAEESPARLETAR